MLKIKLAALITVAAALFTGSGPAAFAGSPAAKGTAKFTVRIENISNAEGVAGSNGQRYPFALSPVLFYVNHKKTYFDEGGKADAAQAK